MFSLQPTYSAPPAHCKSCGNAGPGRLVLDINHDDLDYGRIEFCELCVKDMGRLFGLIDPPVAGPVPPDPPTKQELQQLLGASLDSLHGTVESFNHIVDYIVSFGTDVGVPEIQGTGESKDSSRESTEDNSGDSKSAAQSKPGSPNKSRGTSKASNNTPRVEGPFSISANSSSVPDKSNV